MKTVLHQAGAAFLRAFGAALIVTLPGVLSSPNFDGTIALGISALVGALAAGLKAIQVFIPALSFATLIQQPYAAWLDSFTRAFLAAFLTAVLGWLAMPDLSTWHSVVVGALTGALAAGFRALQGLLTPGEDPAPNSGVATPPPAPPPGPAVT